MLIVGTRVKLLIPIDAELNGALGTVAQVNTKPEEWHYCVELDIPVKIGGMEEDSLWFDEEELEVLPGEKA